MVRLHRAGILSHDSKYKFKDIGIIKMKKFKLGKKYVLHSNANTYECTVKARNELYKPYSVYIILDVKVTMPDNEYSYTRAYKVMDTSYDYECECVLMTSDYYGSILTADNDLNNGKLHYDTLKYIKDNDTLRAFLLEHRCMQLPQQCYDTILHDVIMNNNMYYTTPEIVTMHDFSFQLLQHTFTYCLSAFDNYFEYVPTELLEVLTDDRITLQLMHNILEYIKLARNMPEYKNIINNMIESYASCYRDYINRFTA